MDNRKIIDISKFGEEELLNTMRGYINAMVAFAEKTRNVHKELKDTLGSTSKVFAQYLKVKKPNLNSKVACKSTYTQTESTQVDNDTSNELKMVVDVIRGEMAMQCEAIQRLVVGQHIQEIGLQNEDGINLPPTQETRKKRHAKPPCNEQQELRQQHSKSQAHCSLDASGIKKASGLVESQDNQWIEVKARRNLQSKSPTKTPQSKPEDRKPKPKPPAVLVKVAANSTYADTVRALRGSGELDPSDYGARVSSMRQTREGHLLLELVRGAKSESAADKLRTAIMEKFGDRVGNVAKLGYSTVMEVVGIDAAATKEEILAAVRSAIPGDPNDPAVIIERDAIALTGLWATGVGQQIATLKVARSTATKLNRVIIGWTVCRVRVRTPAPTRCHRCHGFGHLSADCKGPDLSGSCRRCGEDGHIERNCKASGDRCVACDRLGVPRMVHRPGSGACSARRMYFQNKVAGDLQQ